MSLFVRSASRDDFTLHSGDRSDWKIDCDALTYGDLVTIAQQIAARVPPFSTVESIPTGGDRLAYALRGYCRESENVLVADDVWTTGQSMLDRIAGQAYTYGAVIFARGPIYDGRVTALFTADIAEVLRPLRDAWEVGRGVYPPTREERDALYEEQRRAIYGAVADLDRWRRCGDCQVYPGLPHIDGCDVAHCTVCGGQRISCEHEGADVGWGAVWTGEWPGDLEVREGLATDLNDLAGRGAQGLLKWDGWRWRNP